MKKSILLFLSILLTHSLTAAQPSLTQAEQQASILDGILKTTDIQGIEKAARMIPQDSLIIFDVGNVILAFKDAVWYSHHREWVYEWFKVNAPEVDKETWRLFAGILDRDAEMPLVNQALPRIIEEAQRHATVIALSRYWCGPAGTGTTFEEHRIASLNAVGIDLGEPFPEVAGWSHNELKTTYSGGLIQTEATLKGPVLEAFLQCVNWKPKAILFVDDRRDQCQSIATTAKMLEIPVICIQYTEAVDYFPPLDPAIADLQLRTLVNEKRWISDEQARELLQNESP